MLHLVVDHHVGSQCCICAVLPGALSAILKRKENVNPVPARADFLKVTTAWRLSDYEVRQLFGFSRSL